MLVDADVESRIEKMSPTATRREAVRIFALGVLDNPRNEPSPPTLAAHPRGTLCGQSMQRRPVESRSWYA